MRFKKHDMSGSRDGSQYIHWKIIFSLIHFWKCQYIIYVFLRDHSECVTLGVDKFKGVGGTQFWTEQKIVRGDIKMWGLEIKIRPPLLGVDKIQPSFRASGLPVFNHLGKNLQPLNSLLCTLSENNNLTSHGYPCCATQGLQLIGIHAVPSRAHTS